MLKLNLGAGPKPLQGFVNLDACPKYSDIGEWAFQKHLPFTDASVAGITISHALYAMPETQWDFILGECFRVLCPGGVLRITDDDTESTSSPRHKEPYPGIACRTGPEMAKRHLVLAGFTAHSTGPDQTNFVDGSLIQAYRDPGYTFHVEGVKPK